jgi:hypothetical protein
VSALFVDRALAGCCVICNRRLPKRHIKLYIAHANIWTKGGLNQDCREVEVCVCGQDCFKKYENDELPEPA